MTTPSHLPSRLTITLWDFSWYTRTMPGEPFDDLDRAFDEALSRGYNTVRLCAAPLLLFGDHGIDTSALPFVNMGGDTGQRTRWYDARGGAVLNLRQRLLDLLRAAQARDMHVILSSWEYQQSPAFLEGPEWYDMLRSIPPAERHLALARAESAMVTWIEQHGLVDRIAYVEIHNEVDLGRLVEVADPEEDTFWAQRPFLTEALDLLQTKHPSVLSTVCYGIPPYLDLRSIPDNAQVLHLHFYVYGVLGAIERWAGVRDVGVGFPSAQLRSLLRDDAPDFADWRIEIEPWRLEATGISTSMFYAHDWVDPVKWDAWLYEHYEEHAAEMRAKLDIRLRATAIEASHRGVPAVIGEGWIGYTPLTAEFEDGPAGQVFARWAVQRCSELGFWGTLPGSNSAPHHPLGWANEAFQRDANRLFLTQERERRHLLRRTLR